MIGNSWFWKHWKSISQLEVIKDKHGLLIQLIILAAGINNFLHVTDEVVTDFSRILGTSESSIKKMLNELIKAGVFTNNGRILLMPDEKVTLVEVEKKTNEVVPTDDIQDIFDFWKSTMSEASKSGVLNKAFSGSQKLTQPRMKTIEKALKMYDKETLKQAISGSLKDSYFMKEGHIDLPVLLRCNSQNKRNNVEYFVSLASSKNSGKWDVESHNEEVVL